MAPDVEFATFVPPHAVPTVPAARTSYTVSVLPDAVAGLSSRRVTAVMPEHRRLVELYESSFSQNKHMPLWMLRVLSRRAGSEFRAFYDADELCALAFTVCTGRMVYLLYLAVDEQVRSRGYGSRVLRWVRARYPRRPIALMVEPVYPGVSNYDQRERRLAFYLRNGFRETGYVYVDGQSWYPILFSGWVFDPDAMCEALSMASFGLRRPEVVLVDTEGAA